MGPPGWAGRYRARVDVSAGGGCQLGRGKAELLQGNEACARGALAAGLRFFAGYPITPSSEIAEELARELPRVGGKFIQMEDEIASMAAVIGASLCGLKAMTATSGPGFSLKQENIGFAALAEVPCVIVNVQRVGPSTGMPTSPAQGDVMQARWGTHGDHPVVVYSPSSVGETFRLTVEAFNTAEELRVPVILLMDEVVGHMRERVLLPDPEELRVARRALPTAASPRDYVAYRPPEGGDVPVLPAFGEGYRFHVTGLFHLEDGFPSGSSDNAASLVDRLMGKVERRAERLALVEEEWLDDAEVAVLAYGCAARPARQAVKLAREAGRRVGLFRPITLWPFPERAVGRLAERVDEILCVEMNKGQLITDVRAAACGRARVGGLSELRGRLIRPQEILEALEGGSRA